MPVRYRDLTAVAYKPARINSPDFPMMRSHILLLACPAKFFAPIFGRTKKRAIEARQRFWVKTADRFLFNLLAPDDFSRHRYSNSRMANG